MSAVKDHLICPATATKVKALASKTMPNSSHAQATAVVKNLLGRADLPRSLEPYIPVILGLLSGAATLAGVAGVAICGHHIARLFDKRTLHLAAFKSLKMIQRYTKYEGELKTPENIYHSMQRELSEFLGKHAGEKDVKKIYQELKRKAEEEVPELKQGVKKAKGVWNQDFGIKFASTFGKVAASAKTDAPAKVKILSHASSKTGIRVSARIAASKAVSKQALAMDHPPAAAAAGEASVPTLRPAPKIEEVYKEHNEYEDETYDDGDGDLPEGKLEYIVRLPAPSLRAASSAPDPTALTSSQYKNTTATSLRSAFDSAETGAQKPLPVKKQPRGEKPIPSRLPTINEHEPHMSIGRHPSPIQSSRDDLKYMLVEQKDAPHPHGGEPSKGLEDEVMTDVDDESEWKKSKDGWSVKRSKKTGLLTFKVGPFQRMIRGPCP